MDSELCQKLLNLPAKVDGGRPDAPPVKWLEDFRKGDVMATLLKVEERNGQLFEEEVTKLDRWAEDVKISLELEIKTLDAEIKEAKKTSLIAGSLAEKLVALKHIKSLESKRMEKRRNAAISSKRARSSGDNSRT